jgi:acetylornithine deacetylase/succinyl-diaminopimelate desuccinylase-like protein
VSVDPARAPDIRRCAEAACQILGQVGAQHVELIETGGHPMVHARLTTHQPGPTVTVYNHLDVQPADGDDWRSDPFQLTQQDDRYIGRGTTDDKGPALTALLGALAARDSGVPVNIAFLWELEEEVGSHHFAETITQSRERLQTDAIVVSDTIWVTRGKPSSPAGLRGMQSFLLSLRTATHDLHSGITGGVVRNPLAELMQVVAACVDGRTGRVLIPGFYDEVEPLTRDEEQSFLASGFSVETFMRDHQVTSLRETEPLEVMRRLWALPTFEVHGVVGGYTGPGVKAAIPPRAEVKLSCRLVPNMTGQGTLERIRSFVAEHFSRDIEVVAEPGLDPYKGRTSGPLADAVRAAFRFGFGAEAVFTREGGSIGAVPTMERILEAPVVFLGLSLPEHNYHGPNEFFEWDQAAGGIAAFAHFFEKFAESATRIPRNFPTRPYVSCTSGPVDTEEHEGHGDAASIGENTTGVEDPWVAREVRRAGRGDSRTGWSGVQRSRIDGTGRTTLDAVGHEIWRACHRRVTGLGPSCDGRARSGRCCPAFNRRRQHRCCRATCCAAV